MIPFSGFFGEQNEFEKEILWNIINQFNASLLNGRTFYFLKIIIILYVWIFCYCCFIFPFCFSCLFKISENISVYYLFIAHFISVILCLKSQISREKLMICWSHVWDYSTPSIHLSLQVKPSMPWWLTWTLLLVWLLIQMASTWCQEVSGVFFFDESHNDI